MMRRLARAVLFVLLLLQLAGLGLMSLGWNLVATLLYPVMPRAHRSVLGRAAISYGYRVYWACTRASTMMRIEAEELDVLRTESTGLIIAANHPSLLDALAIVARLPRSVCIMKAALMRNIFLGSGARLAGYIANDSPRHMMRTAIHELQQGSFLVLFPEGTRSVGGQLNPFRPGITSIAHKANVPIQTVIIETDSPYLGKGWALWRLPPIPIVFRLRLGRRFDPSPDHGAALQELEAYFRSELGTPSPAVEPRTRESSRV